mgnify:CR=1 FL=1
MSGSYVVVSHEQPRATFVIEPGGPVLVHGIARTEVARIAMQELLLGSYTHLTLPTNREVEISVVPVSLKKKKYNRIL